MIKCIKASENLTVGKLYNCYGLVGAFHVAIRDNSGELVPYLPSHFERENGVFVAYDENGMKF